MHPPNADTSARPVLGLIPAAGRGERLGELPCSKEIVPVGCEIVDGRRVPVPACRHLLEAFHDAGIERALVLLRRGKWDIPELLGDGSAFGLELAYRIFDATAGVPETLDRAFPFVADVDVALGFPDILFTPRHAFSTLLERRRNSSAAAVLGLFPTSQPEKTDMVELDADGRVTRLIIKQPDAGLRLTWSIAVWGSRMTRYLHDFLARRDEVRPTERELYVGNVLQAAIDDGLDIVGVPFPEGSYLDIGTPGDLERARRRDRR